MDHARPILKDGPNTASRKRPLKRPQLESTIYSLLLELVSKSMIVILASRADEVNSRPTFVLGTLLGCAPACNNRSILASWCVTFQSASRESIIEDGLGDHKYPMSCRLSSCPGSIPRFVGRVLTPTFGPCRYLSRGSAACNSLGCQPQAIACRRSAALRMVASGNDIRTILQIDAIVKGEISHAGIQVPNQPKSPDSPR